MAANLFSLSGVSRKEAAKRTWAEILDDDVFGRAAQLAYYFFLALIPFLIFVIASLSIFGTADRGRELRFKFFADALPPAAFELIDMTFSQIIHSSGPLKAETPRLPRPLDDWSCSAHAGTYLAGLPATGARASSSGEQHGAPTASARQPLRPAPRRKAANSRGERQIRRRRPNRARPDLNLRGESSVDGTLIGDLQPSDVHPAGKPSRRFLTCRPCKRLDSMMDALPLFFAAAGVIFLPAIAMTAYFVSRLDNCTGDSRVRSSARAHAKEVTGT